MAEGKAGIRAKHRLWNGPSVQANDAIPRRYRLIIQGRWSASVIGLGGHALHHVSVQHEVSEELVEQRRPCIGVFSRPPSARRCDGCSAQSIARRSELSNGRSQAAVR